MKEKILQEFLNSNVKIKSEEKLIQYIDYCIYHNQIKKKISETEYHHILPKKLFPEFLNLTENPWNGTHLKFENHYIAHSMLIDAISHPSVVFAWNSMNNMNIKNGKIVEPKNLIGGEQYKKLRKVYLSAKKEWDNAIIILEDGTTMTNAKSNAIKARDTMNKQFIKDGKMTTIRLEANKKCSETKNKEYILNGEVTTNAKESAKTLMLNYEKRATRYNIYRKDCLIYENITRKDLVKISQSLLKTGIDNTLGKSKVSADRLRRNNKEHLIGLYSIKI